MVVGSYLALIFGRSILTATSTANCLDFFRCCWFWRSRVARRDGVDAEIFSCADSRGRSLQHFTERIGGCRNAGCSSLVWLRLAKPRIGRRPTVFRRKEWSNLSTRRGIRGRSIHVLLRLSSNTSRGSRRPRAIKMRWRHTDGRRVYSRHQWRATLAALFLRRWLGRSGRPGDALFCCS